MIFFHWLLHITGGDVPPNPYYAELSGFVGDVTYVLAPFSLVYAFLRHKNCEVHGCWRITKHTTAAGHKVCKHHNPAEPMSHQDIIDAHAAALND